MSGMPVTNGGPQGRYPIVAPTNASTPQKRTLGTAEASNAIYEVRIVVDAANANDAMLQMRGVLDDCIVLGREGHNGSDSVWLDAAASAVYVVFIGTSTNTAGFVVTPAESEANFLAAMVTLNFAAIDDVRRIDFKTINPRIAATGLEDPLYLALICEGYSYA